MKPNKIITFALFAVSLALMMGLPDVVFGQPGPRPIPTPGPVTADSVGVPNLGKFTLFAGALVAFACQLLRSSSFNNWIKTVDRRKRILVPLALSAIAGTIGPWLGMIGWEDAVYAGLGVAGTSVGVFGEALFSNAMGMRTGEKIPKPDTTPAPAVEPESEPTEPSA